MQKLISRPEARVWLLKDEAREDESRYERQEDFLRVMTFRLTPEYIKLRRTRSHCQEMLQCPDVWGRKVRHS